MASVVLVLCLVALANVVLGQDSAPSPSSAAPSAVTASGSLQATHIVTVGKVCALLVCRKRSWTRLIKLWLLGAEPV